MKKVKKYRYLGRNGILTTHVQIEGIPSSVIYILTADEDKLLTDGEQISKVVSVYEENIDNWYEINDPEANLDKK